MIAKSPLGSFMSLYLPTRANVAYHSSGQHDSRNGTIKTCDATPLPEQP